jgi:ATP-dependent Clp protease ATP-binding subunit ClpB
MTMALGTGLLLCAASSGRDEEREFLVAAKKSDLNSLQTLLQGGVDVNCRHPLGWTALHSAVVNRHHRVAEFLLGRGADVNAEDEFSNAHRMANRLRISASRGIILFPT